MSHREVVPQAVGVQDNPYRYPPADGACSPGRIVVWWSWCGVCVCVCYLAIILGSSIVTIETVHYNMKAPEREWRISIVYWRLYRVVIL